MTDKKTGTRTLELLKETGALLEGHFLLSSGLHSEHYFQCARLLQNPEFAAETGRALAEACRHLAPEAVVSPAMGGIIIGHEVARALATRGFFAERVDGVLRFRRGFTISPGEKVIVVEDVVTTGKSTLETVDAVHDAGGEVVGLAAIIDRGGGVNLSLPFFALLGLRTPTFEARDCPICQAGKVPLTKPGSRDLPLP
jgi:orotate phosphoribosyltransferase